MAVRIDKPTTDQPISAPFLEVLHDHQTSVASQTLSDVDRRKAELLAFAQSIQVSDQPSFELAAQVRRDVRKVRDHYEELLRPGINDAHALHKRRVAELKSYTDDLDRIEQLIKTRQDHYQEEKRRIEQEEKARLEAEMAKARERILAQQLEQAAQEDDTEQLGSIMERMAEPPPVLPMIHQPAKAEGATSRTVPAFTLLDPAKIDPVWLLRMVITEISLKGECVWLNRQIRKEVEASRARAEKIVGRGSILYEEKISTGVRR